MTDKPETPSQKMSRLIRDTPPKRNRQLMRESIRKSISRPQNGENQ